MTDTAGNAYHCRCLLMATGAIKPNIPADIEGIELAEGYETHDIDPKRFINKRVVILGRGNSAFEVANHLAGHAATIQIFTAGRLVVHAWQTHFVGDLRSINNSILEMNQLKMPHLVSGARVTKIVKQEDGTLALHYDEDVPHWAVPGTMQSMGIYDHVIRCTGWKFVEPALFGPSVAPAVDARSKYAVLRVCEKPTALGISRSGGARNPHVFQYTLRFLRSGGTRPSFAR
ncbi:MAG: NAD(P)-binding domain-containing protein, partial [Gammaproteobacteria bacterium]